MSYKPTELAVKSPRVIKLSTGKKVGIGGSVTITRTPPKYDEVVPEATQEEYKTIYEMGMTTLVVKVQNKKLKDVILFDESDTGSTERPSETD